MKLWTVFAVVFFFAQPSFSKVAVYFNHNLQTSYSEPYRKIHRAGDNLEAVLLAEISKAKKSIFVAVQEFRLPNVAKALIVKRSEGIDVRIVLENNYNFTILKQRPPSNPENEYEASKLQDLKAFVDVNKDGKYTKGELLQRDAIYMLQEAQVPMMDDSFDHSKGSGLMHHKFMIVDGKTTVVSTANFTMSCIHGDALEPGTRGNANSMLVVDSPRFSNFFNDEFLQLWGNGKHGNFGQNKTYRGPLSVTVGGTKFSVQFSPTSKRFDWEDSTNGLIGSVLSKATKSIEALLFVFSDQKLSNILEERQNKGARIGVLIEPNFAYRDYSELLDLMGIQMLNQNCSYETGNNPWKNPAKEVGMAVTAEGDVLHHKFAIIDDKTVVVGSQNWSASANYVNDETMIVIEDKRIAGQFAREYDRVKRSALIGPQLWLKKLIKKIEVLCTETPKP